MKFSEHRVIAPYNNKLMILYFLKTGDGRLLIAPTCGRHVWRPYNGFL